MSETTVFQFGSGQVVRLPKEFRFKSKTIEIFRRGDEVVLRERRRSLGESLAELPPLGESEAADFERAMSESRQSLPSEARGAASTWSSSLPTARKHRLLK